MTIFIQLFCVIMALIALPIILFGLKAIRMGGNNGIDYFTVVYFSCVVMLSTVMFIIVQRV